MTRHDFLPAFTLDFSMLSSRNAWDSKYSDRFLPKVLTLYNIWFEIIAVSYASPPSESLFKKEGKRQTQSL